MQGIFYLLYLHVYYDMFFRPSQDLIRPVLCRDCKRTDFFTVSILKYWAQEYEEKLADLILSHVSKLNGTPKKRQRFVH